MTWRRVAYLLVLAVLAVFYIFDLGYFAFVLFWLAVAFAPLQLLASLPGMLAARIVLRAQPPARQGEAVVMEVRAEGRWQAGRVRAVLCAENLFAASHAKKRLALAGGQAIQLEIDEYGAPCGVVRFSLARPRISDAAGLFALPLRKPVPAAVTLYPPVPRPLPVLPQSALGGGAHPGGAGARPGLGAFREYTDIREYRAGDSIRDIHWKLTAKLDKPVVREAAWFAMPRPVLCFDMSGDVGEAAQVLARVAYLSRQLYARERRHRLYWLTEEGEPQLRDITSAAELDGVLAELLAVPPPRHAPRLSTHLPPSGDPLVLVGSGGLEVVQPKAAEEVAL